MSARRATGGAGIDRAHPLSFTFDGRRLSGFAGDTLASALLANDVALVGRSFKYHRPRGIMTAGVEEPNALVTRGEGASREPNIPATTLELRDGLAARSQNAWPSPGFDVMAVNSLLSPLLGAGFYYKTFMGPRAGSWMMYEPWIRRAAGLGQASAEPDAGRYETRHVFVEVLVIGSGPAGLVAASHAAGEGRVLVVEQDYALCSSLLGLGGEAALGWRAAMLAKLGASPDLTLMSRTTALGVYDGNIVPLLERRDCAASGSRMVLHVCRAGRIVFATGAIERPLVFAGNDRPGVMLASAAQSYLNRWSVAVAERAVVLTNNDSAYAVARDLAGAGVAVTLADLRKAPDPSLLAEAVGRGIAVFPSTGVAKVAGGRTLRGVSLADLETGRARAEIAADALLVSGGWSPSVHLTSHGGIRPRYDAAIAAFVPGGYAESHSGTGSLTGMFDLTAITDGALAGGSHAVEPVWRIPLGDPAKAFVDFQNDVTVKDVVSARQEGYESVEHLKRYTTLGMGTDQGKTSNLNAIGIMAALGEAPLGDSITTTFRPPYTGVALGALAGRSVGRHFRPVRRSPLHEWHAANGARFIEAGPWLRAWYYSWAGDSPETAYVEEMKLVRSAVGLADVSTLGKIDVQGPDAADFLNRVYVNGFAKLPIGRARYGVMLNDDGLVLDDGTTTRISEHRYFMTTTTAQAGEVMSWLEFLAQAVWPELAVHVASVTDAFAGMAVSGPKSREALSLAFPGIDLSNAALPHMCCLEFTSDNRWIRLIRLSFSGELAYEVYVAADQGEALWRHILAAAAPLGIRPYGLEALASLRIEKGHVAGLELDHRNTLDDLGLARMASRDKPFIGKVLGQRPRFKEAERWSLVGLQLIEPGKTLRGGAILFARGDPIKGHGRGYITSVAWSVTLETFIALGLYQGGLAHEGEEVICAYPLKDETVRVRIVSPHFIDPAGERLHG